MRQSRSWVCIVTAKEGTLLLGGVRTFRSSRFQRKQDAAAFGEVIVQNQPGAKAELHPDTGRPEIFVHCPGGHPQTWGALCDVCGKRLTVEDACRAPRED